MNIVVEKLQKSFKELCLFSDLSFQIEDKKITCIFGKSGSGKTTLLNILGAIEGFTSGVVLYDGKELTKKRKIQLLSEEFGFIFQNFGLLDNKTVYENFMIIKRIRKMKKKERDSVIADALGEVGLDGFEKKMVYTLSGGEQQRVSIAKVIAKKSSVIFADEPTASLDKENKKNVIELLKLLKQHGTTIVIVSHDNDIKRLADNIIFL